MATNNQGNKQSDKDSDKKQSDTSNRGFASMDPEKQREIAAEGGRAAHASGHAHEFTSKEAREAGRMSHGGGNQQSDSDRGSRSSSGAGKQSESDRNASGGKSGGAQSSRGSAGSRSK